ncbi:MAG: CHASE4 domain-containing protein [Candidatus Delongbacteria bacterium]
MQPRFSSLRVATPSGTRPGYSLQIKIAVLVGGVYVLLIGLSLLGLERFVMPSFRHMEQDSARQDLARVQQALEREEVFLKATAADWGVWTETWDYLGGQAPDYESNNLTPSAMQALKVDLLCLYDQEGRLVWGSAPDKENGTLLPPPALGPDPLPAGHPLRAAGDLHQNPAGILMTRAGPMLVGARAVVTNENLGPVRGTVVFGRFLDAAAIRQLGEQAGVNLQIKPLAELDARERSELAGLDAAHPTQLETLEQMTSIWHLLSDIEGRPVLAAHLDVPRAISAQGRRAIRLALGAQAASGLLVSLLLLIVLARGVVKPLQRLTAHAIQLAKSGSPAPAFGRDRDDELGILARELNHLMEQLAETRRRLLEQSYDSGKAELAGGILHNIGNSVTPLAVQAEQLRQEIRALPLEDVGLALGELERPELDAGRRRDLQAFARLALEELRQGLERADGSRQQIAHQITHISRILADQERHSRAEQILEPTRLDLLLQEALTLLGSEPLERLEIRLDPELARFGEGCVARVALQQVIINLMINAAEAVAQAGRAHGRLEIRATRDQQLLRLDFIDDGCGFDAAQAEQLFQRGFSTKQKGRSSGLGLHWSSNTLYALGGWLRATSPGAGLGATFSLALPWNAVPGPTRPAAPLPSPQATGDLLS